MQMAGVATFSVLDSWITKLFAHVMKPSLTNMKPPNLHQLLDADKTLWRLVAQNTRGEMLTAGPLKTLQDCPDVSFCLLPQQGGSSKRRLSPESDSGDEAEGGKRKKKKKKGGQGQGREENRSATRPARASPAEARPFQGCQDKRRRQKAIVLRLQHRHMPAPGQGQV